jgi:hypothetical protein
VNWSAAKILAELLVLCVLALDAGSRLELFVLLRYYTHRTTMLDSSSLLSHSALLCSSSSIVFCLTYVAPCSCWLGDVKSYD